MTDPQAPALELRDIAKAYGPLVANRDVSLRVARQSIHAVVGENGAGKSTLMKIAYGHTRADAGEIWIKGERIARHTVAQAISRGVGMVHQHFMLVGSLTVVENVVLGREPRRRGLLDLQRAAAEIRALSEKFGLHVDPEARVEELSVGQQQRVAAARALIGRPGLVVADEPTSALDADRQQAFIDLLLEECAAAGAALLFVSHDARLAAHFDRVLDLAALNHAALNHATSAAEGAR